MSNHRTNKLFNPVFSGFASNTRPEETRAALSFIFNPFSWISKLQKGEGTKEVEKKLGLLLNTSHVQTFDSGRSSLYFALKAASVGEGDQVLVQAFTCMVVINAIKWTGATPVYVDIDDSYCMNPHLINNHITPNSKAIIVQHTFGKSAAIKEIKTQAQLHNLIIIEDCAHTIGGSLEEKKLGTFGDMSIFSFGSDKAISSVRGGAVITNNANYYKKLQEFNSRLPDMSRILILRHLLFLIIFPIAKKIYNVGIGKVLLWIAKKTKLLARIVTDSEKNGKQPIHYPTKYPAALAHVLVSQLKHIKESNTHRQAIAQIYAKERGPGQHFSAEEVPLCYPLHVPDPKKIQATLKTIGVYLNLDWQGSVIVPKDINLKATDYIQGSCPVAEEKAKHLLQLPTHKEITPKRAVVICQEIKKYV